MFKRGERYKIELLSGIVYTATIKKVTATHIEFNTSHKENIILNIKEIKRTLKISKKDFKLL